MDLKCALVFIRAGNRTGTGFYVSPDGDIVTASHVIGDRTFVHSGTQMIVTIPIPNEIVIKTDTTEFRVPSSAVEVNADDWMYDLALIKTAKSAQCWLQKSDDKLARAGEHVIAMGFPGLAFGSLSLYTGIISATHLKSELVMGFTVQGEILKFSNDFIRVQMPISTGISGAPVIDDENKILAVVTQAGAWGPDLELLTQLRERILNSGQPQQPNILDLAVATGHLAELFRDFASPGYGDAVPISYLAPKAMQSGPQSASPVHSPQPAH